MPEISEATQHTVHKSDDDHEFWITCDGNEFARLVLTGPTLSSSSLGFIMGVMESTMRAHLEVSHA